jgi:hypothetical protein
VPQKSVELTAFFYLENDARLREETHALIASFHGHSIIEKCNTEEGGGHEALLKEIALRVEHLHCFLSEHHRGSLESSFQSATQARSLVTQPSQGGEEEEDSLAVETRTRQIDRCIRRQCEAFIYLPLRRFIFDGIAHLEKKSFSLQKRLEALLACGHHTAAVLQVPDNITEGAPHEWTVALGSVRKLCGHYLPCDAVCCGHIKIMNVFHICLLSCFTFHMFVHISYLCLCSGGFFVWRIASHCRTAWSCIEIQAS